MAIKKDQLALMVVIVAVCAGAFYWYVQPKPPSGKEIHVDSHALWVEVADTDASREQGLSGRTQLPEGQGMLFVFDTEDLWGFWMKDMRFPIDMLWADANGRITTVVENASPDSYPQIFYPTQLAKYVLEVPAGYAARNGITEGSRLMLK